MKTQQTRLPLTKLNRPTLACSGADSFGSETSGMVIPAMGTPSLRARRIKRGNDAAAVSFPTAQKRVRCCKALRSQEDVVLTCAVRDIQLSNDDLVQEGGIAVAFFWRCQEDCLNDP